MYIYVYIQHIYIFKPIIFTHFPIYPIFFFNFILSFYLLLWKKHSVFINITLSYLFHSSLTSLFFTKCSSYYLYPTFWTVVCLLLWTNCLDYLAYFPGLIMLSGDCLLIYFPTIISGKATATYFHQPMANEVTSCTQAPLVGNHWYTSSQFLLTQMTWW